MISDYTASAEITPDGKLSLVDQRDFKRAMKGFKRGRVTVRVEVAKGNRTVQQNRYYRLILGIIGDDTGDDPEYLHEFFKKQFNPIEFSFGHRQDVIGGSTTKMSYEDFTHYVDKIRQFVLEELSIVTPDPDPALRGQSRKRRAA